MLKTNLWYFVAVGKRLLGGKVRTSPEKVSSEDSLSCFEIKEILCKPR